VAVGASGVGGVDGQLFGETQQIGGLSQSIGKRNAATDVEQRLILAVDEGGEADGF
jgi:hypothetical protein